MVFSFMMVYCLEGDDANDAWRKSATTLRIGVNTINTSRAMTPLSSGCGYWSMMAQQANPKETILQIQTTAAIFIIALLECVGHHAGAEPLFNEPL